MLLYLALSRSIIVCQLFRHTDLFVNTIGNLNTFQDPLVVASNVYESKRTYHKEIN